MIKKKFVNRKVLRWYQTEGKSLIHANKGAGLINFEMRLGKTLTAISAVLAYPVSRVLIVAPSSAFRAWKNDLLSEGLPLQKLIGRTRDKKKELLQRNLNGWYFLNVDGWREGHKVAKKELNKETGERIEVIKTKWISLPEIMEIEWDAVILDESHFLKDPRSHVSKFFVGKFRFVVPIRICLTGTATAGNPLDVLQQLFFVMGKEAPLDYWTFKSRHVGTIQFAEYIKTSGRKLLSSWLEKWCLTKTRSEVGLDKEKIVSVREIEWPKAARNKYDKLIKDWVVEIDGIEKLTKYGIQQYGCLKQLAGGLLGSKLVHDAKLKELKYLITGELKFEPLLVWANYLDELDIIEAMCKKSKISYARIDGSIPLPQRYEIEEKFQAGKIRILLLQPNTVRMGIDFSRADIAIYYSPPSGSITWRQSQDRILSVAKEGSLLLILLQMEDSIDQDVYKGLENNLKSEEIMFNFVRKLCSKK